MRAFAREARVKISLTTEGLLQPGALERWREDQAKRVRAAIQKGIKDARPRTDAILKEETRRSFKFGTAAPGKFEKAWRIRRVESSSGHGLQIMNLAKWFKIHTVGGTIRPRKGRALLIPINMRLGMRVSTTKFARMIDWLSKEKLLFVRGDTLFVKPVMNTSRRGGVAAGSRVNKRFRTKFQGSKRRPSGFDIKLNEEGLTPIAKIKSSITMRRRFDLERVARSRVAPHLATQIQNALADRSIRF